MKATNQTAEVKRHLMAEGSLTSMQAFLEYGITRLSAIIYNLRKEGHNIESIPIDKQNRYGRHVRFAKYILNV